MSAEKITNAAIVRASIRLGFVLVVAGLVAGCGFQPLYGRNPSADDESVRDKFAEVAIPPIPSRQGRPEARVAVALRNALQFDLNGAAGARSPTHELKVTVAVTDITVTIDAVSGRPTEEIGGVRATYQLIEIATGKIVVNGGTFGAGPAALRQAARPDRRARPRRQCHRRRDPQQARFVFRCRHLKQRSKAHC